MKIEYIPRSIANAFANEYAGAKTGFSAKEISEYFLQYSNCVKHIDFYVFRPSRAELFIESLYYLNPKQQYYSLNDLTFYEYPCKYKYPSNLIRERLRNKLHNCFSKNPIGLAYSKIRETAFRQDWIEAYLNIDVKPSDAITSARTLLETTLKTIIDERGKEESAKGDLGKLIKETQRVLDFNPDDNQNEKQIFSGFSSIINGITAISNVAGDRHGTIAGIEIDDSKIAELVVNFCGSIGIFFIELHLFNNINNFSNCD